MYNGIFGSFQCTALVHSPNKYAEVKNKIQTDKIIIIKRY